MASIFIGAYSHLCFICGYRHVDKSRHMALRILVGPTALHLHLI